MILSNVKMPRHMKKQRAVKAKLKLRVLKKHVEKCDVRCDFDQFCLRCSWSFLMCMSIHYRWMLSEGLICLCSL